MLKNIKLSNYRNFSSLTIGEMKRVNLITGKNNSGKTSILEALFLLSSGGNPQLSMSINSFRGITSATGPADSFRDVYWKTLFSELDTKNQIEIVAQHTMLGKIRLTISMVAEETVELPLEIAPSPQTSAFESDNVLQFKFVTETGKSATGRMRAIAGAIQLDAPNADIPFPTIFLSSRVGNLQEDAARLGRLRKRKQGDLVSRSLRIIEPRLLDIEDNSASGSPMIWGDIGLPELVPLAMMGEGMTRIARIILAISETQNGVILIDEIENGFHHSVIPKVWAIIEQAAEQFDAQVVATTHSFECASAAHEAVTDENFKLLRIENSDNKVRCVSYSSDAITAAFEHNLEIR